MPRAQRRVFVGTKHRPKEVASSMGRGKISESRFLKKKFHKQKSPNLQRWIGGYSRSDNWQKQTTKTPADLLAPRWMHTYIEPVQRAKKYYLTYTYTLTSQKPSSFCLVHIGEIVLKIVLSPQTPFKVRGRGEEYDIGIYFILRRKPIVKLLLES